MSDLRVLVFMGLLVSLTCRAQEYFGEYKDPLKGEFVPARPRPKFKLANQFRFSDPNGLLWTVPARQLVDGASIPQPFWSSIGGPFDGDYIKASVVHDYYCVTKQRTEHDTHRNFYYGMRSAGVPKWKAKLMYWAVATFGCGFNRSMQRIGQSVLPASRRQAFPWVVHSACERWR